MNKNKFDLNSYRKDVFAQHYSNETKLEILKKYLKSKQQKCKDTANKAGITSAISGIATPITALGTGLSIAINPDMVDYPTAAALGILSVAGIATSTISGLIHKKCINEEKDYKYLIQCADAGLNDCKKLKQTEKVDEMELEK